MADRLITDEDALELLGDRCRKHGGATDLARRLNISPCGISLMLSGRRRVSDKVARGLGLRPVRMFVQIERQGGRSHGGG
jgi:hypothetical protein